jgi:hypothetical protein
MRSGSKTTRSRDVDVTFAEWYSRHRCSGSPENPYRVLNLAFTVWDEDYHWVIEQDELEDCVIVILTYCFAHFDPKKGRPDISVEDRFVRFFRSWFRTRLRDMAKDRESRLRRKSTFRYCQWKERLSSTSRKADAFEDWSWFLYGQALRRLSREAQKYIRLKHVQGMTLVEIVPIMGMSKRSLCRKYGFERLVALFQSEVNSMVMSIPQQNMDELVYTLYFEDHSDEDEIARLFCVPEPYIRGIVKGLTGKVMRGLEKEAGRRLFAAS